jgi:parallel beta-helix repeat protein
VGGWTLRIALACVAGLVAAPTAAAHASTLHLSHTRSGVIAHLRGAHARGVAFVVDGRVVVRDRHAPFKVTLRAGRHGLRRGRHRLVARSLASHRRLASVRFRLGRRAGTGSVRAATTRAAQTGSSTGTGTSGGAAAAVTTVLTEPAAGATLGSMTDLTATVDPDGARILWVDFLVDGRVVGSDATAPYTYRLDPGRLGPGPHVLQADARDATFAHALSAPVDVDAAPATYTRSVSTTGALVSAVADLNASGGGSIHLAPGTYTLSGALWVGSGIDLVGSGPDATTLQAPTGTPDSMIRWDSASRDSIRDLTLDYAGGSGIAVALSGSGAVDDLVQDVHIVGLGSARSGVEAWGAHRHGLSVQDSVLDGSGTGSTGLRDLQSDADSSGDSAFRDDVHGFRDYGLMFPAYSQGVRMPGADNIVVGNAVSAIQDPAHANGTNEAGIWLGGRENVAYGNTVSNTGWELVWTGSSCNSCLIAGNTLSDSGVGVYLEHGSGGTVVTGNTISAVNDGVNVEWAYHEGSAYIGSSNVIVRGNTITARKAGVQAAVDDNGLVVEGNVVRAGSDAPVVLQGLDHATVRDNDLRGPGASCVAEIEGLYDTGGIASSDWESVTGNDCRGASAVVGRDTPREGVHDVVSGNLWP